MQGRRKGNSTRAQYKKRHLSKFLQQGPSTAHNVYCVFQVSKIPWKQK